MSDLTQLRDHAVFMAGSEHAAAHYYGICSGCMPDSERALWVSIAEEITAYLGRGDEGQGALL